MTPQCMAVSLPSLVLVRHARYVGGTAAHGIPSMTPAQGADPAVRDTGITNAHAMMAGRGVATTSNSNRCMRRAVDGVGLRNRARVSAGTRLDRSVRPGVGRAA